MPTNTLSNLNPNSPNFIKDVEARLIELEEEYSIETYPSEHRNHLGASAITDDCWRKLWYTFRWVKLGQAEGRMRRLWQRGKDEEKKFEAFLFWAGFYKREIVTPFSKINGHYGGTPDDRWIIKWANDVKIIAEYKTFGSKYFAKLKEDKVRKSNPKYFGQMCAYGKEYEVKYALFYAVNKDTDEWYREFIELDWNFAQELENKARDIIHATIPPDKINQNPAFWICKSCTFQGICHFGEKIEKNCRSCTFATQIENSKWKCNKWDAVIPKDAIKDGCQAWKGIV